MGKGVLEKDSGVLAGYADTLATLAGGNILGRHRRIGDAGPV